MENLKKAVKYILFLLIGILVFWWAYRDVNLKELGKSLKSINYFWIVVSVLLSVLSQVSRAYRWNMLIKPMGYKPKVSNIFLSTLVLYFTNLLLPRAGEVARCTVLSRYEKIPFSKLVGTVIVERFADLMFMMFLAVIIFALNVPILKQFFLNHPEFGQNIIKLLTLSNIILGLIILALIIILFLVLKPVRKGGKLHNILSKLKSNFKEGVKSVSLLENKWYFIGHTVFIFLMWLLMLYAVFLAFKPTSHLSPLVGAFTFLMGGLAMLMPVQGGIGPWHFMVIESLFLFGIDRFDGQVFALVAHTSTNLIYLLFGAIAMIMFPMVNRHYKPAHAHVQSHEEKTT
jgi:glycosyltransferase 2 family protein